MKLMSTPPLAFQLHGEVAIVTGAGSRMPGEFSQTTVHLIDKASGEIGNGRAAAIVLARQVGPCCT